MKLVKASATILASTLNLEQTIELAGRVCYKSEDKINETSAAEFVSKIRSINHESVLEHGSITVRFICDRGVSHELVRHRIASFSQESTRYCNYSKDKFDNGITFIESCFWNTNSPDDINKYNAWVHACEAAEKTYLHLVQCGATAQEARSVLPNSLKTEVVMTANPREWRHVFKLRAAKAAHPQMREIMVPLLVEFKSLWPSLFNDIEVA